MKHHALFLRFYSMRIHRLDPMLLLLFSNKLIAAYNHRYTREADVASSKMKIKNNPIVKPRENAQCLRIPLRNQSYLFETILYGQFPKNIGF